MPATSYSFGTSFGPTNGLTAEERCMKADAETAQARRDALPPAAATWSSVLTVTELEAWCAISRWHGQAGGAAIYIRRADLAAHLRCLPEEADALVDALVKKGALEKTNQLRADPVYRTVEKPPAWISAKGDTAAAARNVKRREADATRFAAGLGLRAR